MIINNTYKFIFIHIPKSAGTSTAAVLHPMTTWQDIEIGGSSFGEEIQTAYRKRFKLYKHIKANELIDIMGVPAWTRYFSFALVRNPFSRALSTYRFLKQWDGVSDEDRRFLGQFDSFEEFVLADSWDSYLGADEMLRPQTSWTHARPAGATCLVDYVGHVENIQHDIEFCLEAIGVKKFYRDAAVVPTMNRSDPASVSPNWTERVMNKIANRYRTDFTQFGYPARPDDRMNVTGAAAADAR
jgi:hypothetical protein